MLLLSTFAFWCCPVITQSCCEYKYRISGNGNFTAYNLDASSTAAADKITGPFSLYVKFETVGVAALQNAGLFSSAYALSCAETPLNRLVEEELKLSLDKDMLFENTPIPAGTDLSKLTGMVVEGDPSFGFVHITFPEDFMNRATLQRTTYTFQINTKTTDNLALEDTLTVYLKL